METATTTQPPLDRLSSDVRSTLDRLLDAELAYDTDARNGFTSHLAMGLVAGARLGADPDTLERWFERDIGGGYLLARAERPARLVEAMDRVSRRGIEAEVRSSLGDLVDRTGGFFHWMIRLELAIDAGHPGQVANALSDWKRRSRRDPSMTPRPSGTRSVADVLRELWIADPTRPGSGASRSEAPGNSVAEVADHPGLLDEVAAAVADLHWVADDFVTLHMVTGTSAARALNPFLEPPDQSRLAHAHLHAVAEVVPRISDPTREPAPVPEPESLPGWEDIERAALVADDVHVVKLVYAARCEEAVTGRHLYRAIAARATRTADEP